MCASLKPLDVGPSIREVAKRVPAENQAKRGLAASTRRKIGVSTRWGRISFVRIGLPRTRPARIVPRRPRFLRGCAPCLAGTPLVCGRWIWLRSSSRRYCSPLISPKARAASSSTPGSWAERSDATLTLYHAVETPTHRFAHWAFAQDHEVWLEAERQARKALERCAREIGSRARVVVERTASAHEAIVERIRTTRPDHLARVFGAELICIHVAPSRSLATLGGMVSPEIVVVPSEASLWKFVSANFAGLPLTAQVDSGTIWERIVHTARTEQADLIVMSTRGHDSLADHVLGSNTERVVRHAPCPVLVA
jgi:nucleotide-binding universal stress UspA family protein